MFKYAFLLFIIVFVYILFAEVFPVYKNTDACVTTFVDNYVRVGLLDNSPSGDAGRKFCKDQKVKIINLESCLDDSKEKESIKGLTDLFFRTRLLFSTSINSLNYEKSRYNEVCGGYPRLKFKNINQ